MTFKIHCNNFDDPLTLQQHPNVAQILTKFSEYANRNAVGAANSQVRRHYTTVDKVGATNWHS